MGEVLYQITLFDSNGRIVRTRNQRLPKRSTHRETLTDREGAKCLTTAFPTLRENGSTTRVCIKEITNVLSPMEYELDDEIRESCYALELREVEPGAALDCRTEYFLWRNDNSEMLEVLRSEEEASPRDDSTHLHEKDQIESLAEKLRVQRFALYVPGSREIPESVVDIVCNGASSKYALIGELLGVTPVEMSREPEEKTESMKLRQRIIKWVQKNAEKATLCSLLKAVQQAGALAAILARLNQLTT